MQISIKDEKSTKIKKNAPEQEAPRGLSFKENVYRPEIAASASELTSLESRCASLSSAD